MAKLILSMDGLVLKEIVLTKERITIGRKAMNDIQIDNLAISGEHAAIATVLNDSFLEDLNSTNGTLVNGQPIKKHFLKNNDVIELGKYKLKFIMDQAQNADADYEKTMVMSPNVPAADAAAGPSDQASSQQANALPKPMDTKPGQLPPQSASTPARAIIQILTGSNAGRELELTKTLTTLGKAGGQVAVIAKRPQGCFITHVEGAQFPILNGQMLDAQAHQLKDHDTIEIAGVKMEFFLKN